MTAGRSEGSRERALAALRPYLVPGIVGTLAALAELGGEPLRLSLRYDREGLAEGEIWRLITGHLVHLGPSHMAMDVLALAVLAFVFARFMKPLEALGIFLVSALSIDAGLYFISTSVDWYVGLSGVLHGYWALGCILSFERRQMEAWAFTALLVAKLGYEALFGPLTLTGEIAAGPVVSVAHAYGAAGGLLYGLAAIAIRSRSRPL